MMSILRAWGDGFPQRVSASAARTVKRVARRDDVRERRTNSFLPARAERQPARARATSTHQGLPSAA
jgi:hypothetical protein